MAEIDSMFILEEAAIIKAIPLSLFDRDDLHFWPYTQDGVYTVKSGYRVLMEQEDTESQVTADRGVVSNVWKAIWSMRVPNRVRTLVWQTGTNSLPTKVNLVRRKVLNEDVCLECKAQAKDTMHALWTCPILEDMWKVSFNRLMVDTGTCSNFIEILEQASTDKFTLELFAMMVSEVWQHRNRACVGESVVSLNMLSPKASDALREFQQLGPNHTAIPRTTRVVKWKPPSASCVKVNFHDALFSQDELAGIGVIIRNDQGLVMAALSQ